jgi:arsenate reductase
LDKKVFFFFLIFIFLPITIKLSNFKRVEERPVFFFLKARMNNSKTWKIMFVCKKNSARSQMAEGCFQTRARYLDKRWYGEKFSSASFSHLGAISKIRPEAVITMEEIGIDISLQRSKALADFQPSDFNVVISLCGCGAFLPPIWQKAEVFQDWQLDDPAVHPELFPVVRDQINVRVTKLIDLLLSTTPSQQL